MEKKTHVYEVIDHSQGDDKVVAEFWWNGRKVECSKQGMLDAAKYASPTVQPKDGIPFLENLPKVFKNGYLQVRKKKEDDTK